MRHWTSLASYHTIVLRRMLSARFFFFISCVSFAVSVIWIASVNRYDNSVQEALENVGRDIRYTDVYRKPERLPKTLKYILLWTERNFSPFYFLGNGQRSFIDNSCSMINCYVTDSRNLLGSITEFDAIAFNGRNLKYLKPSQLPRWRSEHQKYIYFNLESAENYPVCDGIYDSYFNWTATYRLDSDIPYPYLLIRNSEGEIIGPKLNMQWQQESSKIDQELYSKIQNKSKAAAWFVSHCSDRSGRQYFVKELSKALESYGYNIDVYGKCGNFDCPLEKKAECDSMLEKDYFFYLSFENSYADDYVTEKLLTALHNNIVPIVYGAANYSRFLPPGSYLDASSQSATILADTMVRYIKSLKDYLKFFNWKKHYTYHDPTSMENVCAVCEALNNKTLMKTPTAYTEFRKWWHPTFQNRCGWGGGEI